MNELKIYNHVVEVKRAPKKLATAKFVPMLCEQENGSNIIKYVPMGYFLQKYVLSEMEFDQKYEDVCEEIKLEENGVDLNRPARKFYVIGDRVEIHLTTSGVIDRILNLSDVVEYLGNPSNVTFYVNKDGRTRVALHKLGVSISIGKLMMARYYYKIPMKEVVLRLDEFNKMLEEKKWDVEHCYEDYHNHMPWNLVFMDQDLNRRKKKDKWSRIRFPFITAISVDGTGGVRVKYKLGKVEHLVYCATGDDWGTFVHEDLYPMIKETFGNTGIEELPYTGDFYELCDKMHKELDMIPLEDFTIYNKKTGTQIVIVKGDFDDLNDKSFDSLITMYREL